MKKIISIIFAFAMVLSSAGMTAAAEGGRFVDVPDDAWYAQHVSDCAEKGLMIGNPDNEFEPEAPITRGQFVQTLYTYYQKNIKGTDIEFLSAMYSGRVATTTEINGTYPFTLEETVKVNIPASSEVAQVLTLQATREDLLSGKYPASMSAYHVTQDVNKVISFESSECLTVIPDSPAERCVIRMTGGSCCSSRFSGFAERVTVRTDIPKVEAKTRDGADFEIILCDVDSRTQVLVWGKSSGDLSAELSGYDLTVRGAKGIYNVYVYEW
ncbi:MAG: S-layer homology domain-containing protein, partial [Clostridia bacterium]|nr:S-layer homology domain-containing protein [Clostridia bacterium]